MGQTHETFNDRGVEKENARDFSAAIVYYSKAISLNPNYATAYRNRGDAKTALYDYTGAIQDYTMAIKIKPNFPDGSIILTGLLLA
jgi:tetratricopeptide (TPR) repeat protein